MLKTIALVLSLRAIVVGVDDGNYVYLFFGAAGREEANIAFTTPNPLPISEGDNFVTDIVADCQDTKVLNVYNGYTFKSQALFCNARSVSYGSTLYFSNTWSVEEQK